MTYFCPALDPPLGGSGRKTTTLVRDHEYFIPSKFHRNPSSSSGEEVENVKSLRLTDGWTDGRRTVRYDNSSLEPSAQVSYKKRLPTCFEIIAMHTVCCCSVLEMKSFRERTPHSDIGQGGHLDFSIGPKNTNLVENFEI